MAQAPALLRIASAESIGDSTRALEIERVDGAPFDTVGGKYIIVHTGLTTADGKAVKRAYSLVPVQRSRSRCHLFVKRLREGPGSNELHRAEVGTVLSFSGPWGKLVAPQGVEEGALFVATDTGITSALSAVTYAQATGQRMPAGVLWLHAEGESFLSVAEVRQRIEGAGARFARSIIPPVGADDRLAAAWPLIEGHAAEHGASVVLASGDGAVVHPLKGRFPSARTQVREVRFECFFNNPERKSG